MGCMLVLDSASNKFEQILHTKLDIFESMFEISKKILPRVLRCDVTERLKKNENSFKFEMER